MIDTHKISQMVEKRIKFLEWGRKKLNFPNKYFELIRFHDLIYSDIMVETDNVSKDLTVVTHQIS